jgi:hypothetical protein
VTNATGEVLPDIWFWDSPAISATSATNATSDTSDTNDTNTAQTLPEEFAPVSPMSIAIHLKCYTVK